MWMEVYTNTIRKGGIILQVLLVFVVLIVMIYHTLKVGEINIISNKLPWSHSRGSIYLHVLLSLSK